MFNEGRGSKSVIKYMNEVEISLSKKGNINVINVIDVEDYIKGYYEPQYTQYLISLKSVFYSRFP